MWITAAPDDEPPWEGKLCAIESEELVGKWSYRNFAPQPTSSLESPGTVSIGRPRVLPIASICEAGKLAAPVQERLEQADYFLVQLSCSFRPERDEVIDWARFAVSLNSSSPGDVFAAELHPLSVVIKEKQNVKVGISSSLKFCEVAEPGAEYCAGIEYPELVPTITAAGVGESHPSWDYTRTRRRKIAGSKLMSMIVRTPKGTDQLTASFTIQAVVRAHRFRVLFGPDKRGDQLRDLQLWAAPRGQRPDANDPNQMKDFFISYTKADQAWAEWIAWELEEVGYSTVIQAWDFRPGSNFVLAIQQAAKTAYRTIAVLSPKYLESRFTASEWAAAFAQDPEGTKQNLIPIRIAPCELTGILAPINYLDLVGLAEEDARAALLGAFRTRNKPSYAPAFPGPRPASQPGFPGISRHNAPKVTEDLENVVENSAQNRRASQLSTFGRLEFMRQLNAILPQQFNMLVVALNPEPGLVPAMPAPQADRTTALVMWAEGPNGCGLNLLQELLKAIRNSG